MSFTPHNLYYNRPNANSSPYYHNTQYDIKYSPHPSSIISPYPIFNNSVAPSKLNYPFNPQNLIMPTPYPNSMLITQSNQINKSNNIPYNTPPSTLIQQHSSQNPFDYVKMVNYSLQDKSNLTNSNSNFSSHTKQATITPKINNMTIITKNSSRTKRLNTTHIAKQDSTTISTVNSVIKANPTTTLLLELAEPVYETSELAVKAFKQIFYDLDIESNKNWRDIVTKIISDKRFKALKTNTEREAVFNEWKLEADSVRKQLKLHAETQLEQDYVDYLVSINISRHSNWSEMESKVNDQTKFQSISSVKKKELFDKKKREIAKTLNNQLQTRKDAFLTLIKSFNNESLINTTANTSDLSDFERSIANEPAYLQLNERERREVFASFLVSQDLEAEELDREANIDEEEELKQYFFALLEELAYENQIHANSEWKEVEALLQNCNSNLDSGNNNNNNHNNNSSNNYNNDSSNNNCNATHFNDNLQKKKSEADDGQLEQKEDGELEEGEMIIDNTANNASFKLDPRYENVLNYQKVQLEKAKNNGRSHSSFNNFVESCFLEFVDYLKEITEEFTNVIELLLSKYSIYPQNYGCVKSLLEVVKQRFDEKELQDIQDFELNLILNELLHKEWRQTKRKFLSNNVDNTISSIAFKRTKHSN